MSQSYFYTSCGQWGGGAQAPLAPSLNPPLDENDIKEEVPRTCRLQKSRCNVPYSSEEEYYRRAVYVPYLDDFCGALNERFETHKELISSLQCVLPEFCLKSEFSSLDSAFTFYSEDLSFKEIVQSEFIQINSKNIEFLFSLIKLRQSKGLLVFKQYLSVCLLYHFSLNS